MHASLIAALTNSPVIPAVRSPDDLAAARASPSRVLYLLTGDVRTIGTLVDALRNDDNRVVVNLDLVDGLSRDRAAVEFLASVQADGVISTHSSVLKAARALRLIAIQHTFLLDSSALANAVHSLEGFIPDAVEVLPAPVAPRALEPFRQAAGDLSVIAGGLVRTLAEVDSLVGAGITAVSVSDPSLWIV